MRFKKKIREDEQKKKKHGTIKKNLMLPMIINSLFINSRISTNEFRLYWLVMASFIKRIKGLEKVTVCKTKLK